MAQESSIRVFWPELGWLIVEARSQGQVNDIGAGVSGRDLARSLMSFELLLALFLYSGAFKKTSGFSLINDALDLTVLAGGLVLIASVWRIVARRVVPGSKLILFFLLSFSLFCGVCLTSLLIFGVTADGEKKIIQLLGVGGIGLIASLAWMDDLKRVQKLLLVTFVLGLWVSISGIASGGLVGSHVQGPLRLEDGYQWVSRLAFMSLVVGVVYLGRVKGVFLKVLWVAGCIVLFFGMIVGGARQAVFALGVVAMYFVWLKMMELGRLRVISVGAARSALTLCGVLFVLVIMFWDMLGGQFEQTRGYQRVESATELFLSGEFADLYESSSRGASQLDAIDIFFSNPFFGVGFGHFRDHASTDQYRHPHNFGLEVLAELGITGFIFFMLLIVPVLVIVLKVNVNLRSRDAGVFASLILGYLSMAAVSGDLGTNRLVSFFILTYLVVTRAYHMRGVERAFVPHGFKVPPRKTVVIRAR